VYLDGSGRLTVAPELRAALRRTPRLPIIPTWARRLVRFVLRRLPAAKLDGVSVEQMGGVRVYRPAQRRSDAALFWIHGGGLIIGQAVQDDQRCGLVARELGVVVVSVEYRKAPEHRFPAALDDCHAGWEWLQRNAVQLGVAPARVAIGGQSAGGGLAAALVQRLHDAGGPQPIAQWLLCPMLDDRTAARAELDGVGHSVWNNRLNRFGWQSYLGVAPGSPAVPPYAVAARREELSGLAPAWIGVGDIDLFCAEDRAYADRLRAAGVDTTLHVVPGAPHGFETWAPNTSVSRAYLHAALGWLGRALGRDTVDHDTAADHDTELTG
jgi:acetyl esterase/lipase